jgi:hypothetical protein
METEPVCEHIKEIKELKLPKALVCEECIKTGSDWVHLRTCQTCGVTLCCDSSPNTHMTKHNHHTNHPVLFLQSREKNGCGVMRMKSLWSMNKKLLPKNPSIYFPIYRHTLPGAA